jgi:glutathione S-transferase
MKGAATRYAQDDTTFLETAMTLKLYYASGACSFVPHTMLELAGATFEPVAVKLHKNEQRSPEYLAVNPRGQVPTLVVDGQAITQILAIVAWIDSQFPENAFIPKDPLARAFRRGAGVDEQHGAPHLHPHLHAAEVHRRRGGAAGHQGARARIPGAAGRAAAARAAAHAAGEDWLGGAHCGPLDTYALTLLRWGTIAGINPEDTPTLWAHAQRTAQVPAVARAMERGCSSACIARRPEAHGKAGARGRLARVGVVDLDAGLVLAGDLLDDGQAQARAIDLAAQHAVEGLEHVSRSAAGMPGPLSSTCSTSVPAACVPCTRAVTTPGRSGVEGV